jgi:prophage regulatory protein
MAQQVPAAFDRQNHIIRRPEVEQRVGLSRSALYRRISEGTFPRPVTIGDGRAVGWLAHEVDEFLARCVALRDEKGGVMRTANDCAPAGCTVEARGVTKTFDPSVPHHAPAGKAVAVWLYCIGAQSIGETQAAFDRRPSWRAA